MQPSPFSYEIKIFIITAKSSTFVEAAYNSGLQQSSITKIIKKLEGEFGKKLFIRSSKGIVLTDFGKCLYEMYLQTLNFWESVYFDWLNQDELFVGELSIGCHPSIAINEFSKFYPFLITEYPKLNIKTTMDTSMNITKAVSDYKIDIGLVINPVKNQDLIVKAIRKEYVSLWGDNKANDVVLYNSHMYSQSQLIKKFKNKKLMAIDNYEVIASLVKTQSFLGLLPNAIANRHHLNKLGADIMSTNLSIIYNKNHLENSFKLSLARSIIKLIKS